MELKRYLSTLWKWAWLIVLATILAGGVSYWNSQQMPKLYRTVTTLRVGEFLSSTDPGVSELNTSQQLAQNYVASVSRRPTLQATIDALGLGWRWEDLARSVSANWVWGTTLIQVYAVDTEPVRARAIADELARQVILQSPSAQEDAERERQRVFVGRQLGTLQGRIENGEAQLQELDRRLATEISATGIEELKRQMTVLQDKISSWQTSYVDLLKFYGVSRTNYLTIVEPAYTPASPISPDIPSNVLMAAAVGFLLAAGAALLLEYLDDTMRSAEDVEAYLGLPSLGSIVRFAKVWRPTETLVDQREAHSPGADAFRTVRANIQFASVDQPVRMVLVTSPGPQEGKSLVAANLAVSFAQAGKKTILVDADLRRPTVHDLFGLSNDAGLTSLFLEDPQPGTEGIRESTEDAELRPVAIEQPAQQASNGPRRIRGLRATKRISTDAVIGRYLENRLVQTQVENLLILPSGITPADPADLLGSARMENALRVLSAHSDVLILDTAPIVPVADTALLASKGITVLLVIEAGRTRKRMAQAAKRILLQSRATTLGVIMNGVPANSVPYYGYQGYGTQSRKWAPFLGVLGRDKEPKTGTGTGAPGSWTEQGSSQQERVAASHN